MAANNIPSETHYKAFVRATEYFLTSKSYDATTLGDIRADAEAGDHIAALVHIGLNASDTDTDCPALPDTLTLESIIDTLNQQLWQIENSLRAEEAPNHGRNINLDALSLHIERFDNNIPDLRREDLENERSYQKLQGMSAFEIKTKAMEKLGPQPSMRQIAEASRTAASDHETEKDEAFSVRAEVNVRLLRLEGWLDQMVTTRERDVDWPPREARAVQDTTVTDEANVLSEGDEWDDEGYTSQGDVMDTSGDGDGASLGDDVDVVVQNMDVAVQEMIMESTTESRPALDDDEVSHRDELSATQHDDDTIMIQQHTASERFQHLSETMDYLTLSEDDEHGTSAEEADDDAKAENSLEKGWQILGKNEE